MSIIGFVFCGIYLMTSGLSLLMALIAGGDDKGRFVFLQLPVAWQGTVLYKWGMLPMFDEMSAVAAYAIVMALTLAFLYLVGCVLYCMLRLIIRTMEGN